MNNAYDYLAHFYDELMEVDYKNWAKYLISFLKNPERDILDLGCGTAKLSYEFFIKDYDIIAVDSSKSMLNIAWHKYGDSFPILKQDAKDLDLGKKFDAVISTCDVMNYILEVEELTKVFLNVKKHLLPNGKFIFDISSEYKLKNLIGDNIFFEDKDELTYIWNNNFQDNLLEMEMTFFYYNQDLKCYQRFDETHIQRAWSINEMTSVLEDIGFNVENIFECFTRNAPNELTERILIIAKSL